MLPSRCLPFLATCSLADEFSISGRGGQEAAQHTRNSGIMGAWGNACLPNPHFIGGSFVYIPCHVTLVIRMDCEVPDGF